MWRKFWQHFLSDQTVLARIADTVLWLGQELWCDQLVEIGPGQWVLTRLIVDSFRTVRLMEIDTTLESYLTPFEVSHPDLQIVWWDVLQQNHPHPSPLPTAPLGEGESLEYSETLVVGNLPYYITSPIFRKFFVDSDVPGGVFLIQKEVAQKIATDTKQKSYLRWLLNYGYDIEYNFLVSATAFDPPPKVQSAVVSFRKKKNPHPGPLPKGEGECSNIDFDRMVEFLDIVSQYTRKTMRKIRKMRKDDLESFVLPDELEMKRVQELTREEMRMILNR